MAFVGEIIRALERLVGVFFKKGVARRRTKAHLEEMHSRVDTALAHEWWPPNAPVARWSDAWAANGEVLTGFLTRSRARTVERAYGFADEFARGVDAGARPFDALAQNPGEDKDFFERRKAALIAAEQAL